LKLLCALFNVWLCRSAVPAAPNSFTLSFFVQIAAAALAMCAVPNSRAPAGAARCLGHSSNQQMPGASTSQIIATITITSFAAQPATSAAAS
jgi:hypothetical protein